MTATYQDVDQMIRDGASAEEIEAVLADERTALTDAQIEALRSDLAARTAAATTALQARARRVAGNAQRLDPSLRGGDAAYVEAYETIRQTGHATARQVVASLRRAAREYAATRQAEQGE